MRTAPFLQVTEAAAAAAAAAARMRAPPKAQALTALRSSGESVRSSTESFDSTSKWTYAPFRAPILARSATCLNGEAQSRRAPNTLRFPASHAMRIHLRPLSRTSRNGRAISHPKSLKLRFATFASLYASPPRAPCCRVVQWPESTRSQPSPLLPAPPAFSPPNSNTRGGSRPIHRSDAHELNAQAQPHAQLALSVCAWGTHRFADFLHALLVTFLHAPSLERMRGRGWAAPGLWTTAAQVRDFPPTGFPLPGDLGCRGVYRRGCGPRPRR
jgi:hypothetical protein